MGLGLAMNMRRSIGIEGGEDEEEHSADVEKNRNVVQTK